VLFTRRTAPIRPPETAGELRAMAVPTDRPSAGRPAAAAWPLAHRLFLEWRMRLPGYGRTGTPVNDVEDYRLVVD